MRPMNQIPRLALLRAVPYPWVVVGLALLAQVAEALPGQGLPVLYPFIREEMGLSRGQVGLITSAMMGGGIVTAYLGGWVTDRWGVWRVMAGMLLFTSLTLGAIGLAGSYSLLLLLGVAVGASQGPAYPATTRAIMDWLPPRSRGLAMGLKQTGVPVAGALSAGLLPALAEASGWRVGALLLAGVVLACGVLFVGLYRDAPGAQRTGGGPGLGSLALLVRDRALGTAVLWSSTFVALQFILMTYILIYLREQLGMPVAVAGGALAVAQIASIVSRVAWGAVSDFLLGTRRLPVLLVIGVVATACLLATAWMGPSTPTPLVYLVLVGFGATVLAWQGIFGILVGELAGPARTATMLGSASTVMRVSMMVIPPLFGLLVDAMGGSYRLAWLLGAGMALLATLALAVLGREPVKER